METTTYKGIDYGFGKTNINVETGIRYGVISQNSVTQAWAEKSEPEYSNTCPHCGNEPKSGKKITDMLRCPSCYKKLKDGDFDYQEPTGYIVNGEYKAVSGHGDIIIIDSPYFTYAQFCSPCAPGACYLENPLAEPDENNKCYCFGPEWFDDEKAPYTVYSIKP